jgi:hypothetical protein
MDDDPVDFTWVFPHHAVAFGQRQPERRGIEGSSANLTTKGSQKETDDEPKDAVGGGHAPGARMRRGSFSCAGKWGFP